MEVTHVNVARPQLVFRWGGRWNYGYFSRAEYKEHLCVVVCPALASVIPCKLHNLVRLESRVKVVSCALLRSFRHISVPVGSSRRSSMMAIPFLRIADSESKRVQGSVPEPGTIPLHGLTH